ncbi:uncharacterized protein K489DRAFT_401695 [Dissoconium aciculare CBS 342.82]|uniref:F-box domain-containing protein n=1 Tax=Dissoconium aciculare CBS 342.82 TaxID=1314786 RepID=A0A6J3M5Q6_9PEZI|nr:uncharacterized protein K489DRAFT_401695 [Dissoconium aciculare CBS 342.82]KAF1823213.1 hypothetical protein K489DRAFT_401695 [Dissoconium aciculare CBS 342.82]
MSLEDLPPELISHVSRLLCSGDRLQLRQVCKYLERCTFQDFRRRFRKIGFLITTSSLTILHGIASHPELSKAVEHIWFNPDLFTLSHIFTNDGVPDRSRAEKYGGSALTTSQNEIYGRTVMDHLSLLNKGTLTAQLLRSIESLPRLRTIGMRRGTKFRPLGRLSLQNAVGLDPRLLDRIRPMLFSKSHLSSTTKLLVWLVRTLSEHTSQLERLYVDCSELDEIAPNFMTVQHLRLACHNIRDLELNAFAPLTIKHNYCPSGFSGEAPYPRSRTHDVQNMRSNMHLLGKETFAIPECARLGYRIVQILGAMPILESLALYVSDIYSAHANYCTSAVDEAGDPLPQGYAWAAFARIAGKVSMTNLTSLKLDSIRTTAFSLNMFLSSTALKLQTLKLRYIKLLSPDNDNGHRKQPLLPWRRVFFALASDYANLCCVLFDGLQVWEDQAVLFAGSSDEIDGDDWDIDERDADIIERLKGCFPATASPVCEAQGLQVVRHRLRSITKNHWYRPTGEWVSPFPTDSWYSDSSGDED